MTDLVKDFSNGVKLIEVSFLVRLVHQWADVFSFWQVIWAVARIELIMTGDHVGDESRKVQ
jgi:hypothetical protein